MKQLGDNQYCAFYSYEFLLLLVRFYACWFKHVTVLPIQRMIKWDVFETQYSLCVERLAAGCADVDAWPGSLVERFADRLLVRCNRSHNTWHLMCRNSRWVGNFDNCSDPGKIPSLSSCHAITMYLCLTIFL